MKTYTYTGPNGWNIWQIERRGRDIEVQWGAAKSARLLRQRRLQHQSWTYPTIALAEKAEKLRIEEKRNRTPQMRKRN